MIQSKRVYDRPEKTDGVRILVERLWPRGVRKVKLKLDSWSKEVAPSTQLRKWFSHDPPSGRNFSDVTEQSSINIPRHGNRSSGRQRRAI